MAYGAILGQTPPTPTATNVTVQASTASDFGISGESNVDAVLQAAATMISEGAKIETGSYIGTGTYGENYPNSLTFGFVPSIVFIYITKYGINWYSGNTAYFNNCVIWLLGTEEITIKGNMPAAAILHFSLNNKTLQYYTNGNDSSCQLNSNDVNYTYIAIG